MLFLVAQKTGNRGVRDSECLREWRSETRDELGDPPGPATRRALSRRRKARSGAGPGRVCALDSLGAPFSLGGHANL